ncbi:MAG: carbon-nitrogen family hydrolase [Deltaproteobacteria bacterium]|nr:carbon-nitrogen family hydrolase [Deltaproteobacteria bacterium]
MKVAALQFDIAWEDRQENYRRVSVFAEQAKAEGADLFILPEMFATGFSMNPSVTAEQAGGETATFMRSIAQKHRMGVIGGFVIAAKGGKGHNVALAIDREGRDLASYSKTHLFSFLDEEKFHEPGDGPVPFEFEGVRCACYVCFDLRFPELFRLTADSCDAVFVVASWPNGRQLHWDTLLPARAVENQQYIVGVNRVGQGGGHQFDGGSAIYDPFGLPLARGEDSECMLMADIDPAKVSEIRSSMPFLEDRRF